MQPAFSPTQLLTDLGFGEYVAAAVSLCTFVGFILAHTMPFIAQPSSDTKPFLVFLWKVANSLTGGYGNAKPSATVIPPATAAQVVPVTPPGPQ